AAEQFSENRNIAETFDLVQYVGDAIVDQSGDGETLAVLENNFGFGNARGNRGDQEALQRYSIGEIQGTHFGLDFEVNAALGSRGGSEIELHAKFLELHGNYGSNAGARRRGCDCGKWELAACEETRLGTFDHDQIGLSKDLRQILRFQRFHG